MSLQDAALSLLMLRMKTFLLTVHMNTTQTEVLMMSASSEDVALSFVVHEKSANTLVELLHTHLIPVAGGDEVRCPVFFQAHDDARALHISLHLCVHAIPGN